jgi:hypothetical protein
MDIYIRGRKNTHNQCQICKMPLEAEITFIDHKRKNTIIRLCSGCRYRLYSALHEYHMKTLDKG